MTKHLSFPAVSLLASSILISTLVTMTMARLDLTTSLSQVCTPLNVTWTPTADGYPYTVWVTGLRGAINTYRINSDYQPNSPTITFQFVVPPPSIGFTSYVVTVADSKGNANTTRPMSIGMPDGANTNCDPFVATVGWTWAGDPDKDVGTMTQCGNVRFYNIGNRGTRPFTISWVPIQGVPITVNVPNSATLNNSAFIYNSTVPFPQGTQFQIILGDAQGGASGGASELYVAGPSKDDRCLQPGYTLPNSISDKAIPAANNIATFRNLAGAIDPNAPSNNGGNNGHGGNNVGAIAGGAIGGAVALGIFVGCLIAYLLYKKRQKAKKEQARKEDSHFVDLDGDEDESADLAALAASRRRPRVRDGGVQQTYSVSPFTYQPTSTENDPAPLQGLEMTSHSGRPGSLGGASGTDALAAPSMARVPSSNHSGVRPTSSHSFGSGNGLLSSSPIPPVSELPPAPFAVTEHARRDSRGSNYRLRATNDDATTAFDLSHAASFSRQEAGPLPHKAPLAGGEETQLNTTPGRRVVMHSDAGPLPQPESDDDLEELPPQYGGWSQPSGAQLNRGASTSRRQLNS